MMEANSDMAEVKCPVSRLKPSESDVSGNKANEGEDSMIIELEDDGPDVEISESDAQDDNENYDDETIHSLLEDGIKKIGDGPKTFKKVVMKQVNEIDLHILPEDWLEVSHHSGIPVYLDRRKRVISISRPYHLGNGSVRRHAIPFSAIPCLNYRRYLVKEGRSMTFDAGCVTEDIQKQNSIPDEEVVIRIPSATDSMRLPQCPSNQKDTQEKPETQKPENSTSNVDMTEKEKSKESTSDAGVAAEKKRDTERNKTEGDPEDVEEGEILSENDEVQNKEKDSSRKRPRVDSEKAIEQSTDAAKTECAKITGKECDIADESQNKKPRVDEKATPEVTELANVESSVISVQDKEKELLLDPMAVQQYCRRLFEFEEEHKVRFKTLRNKYKFLRTMRKITREKPVTMMPEKANLIRYKIPLPPGAPANAKPREFVTNPTGKSFICILHEYCQMAVRRPPTYQFEELENSPTPYSVTVLINGTVYGKGFGDSKKRAKLNAAKITLEMLIPGFAKIVAQMEEQAAATPEAGASRTVSGSAGAATAAKAAGLVSGPSKATGTARGWKTCSPNDLELFDSISISDRRLQEISMRMALPGPHAILCEYLRRQCISEQSIKMEMTPKANQKSIFTMSVMGETVTVSSRSKREGRHLAAQALLQRFHPHISTWSGILKLYGPGSKPDRKVDQEVITELQSREKGSVKNSLIDLLKSQMKSLAEEWDENGELHKGKFYIAPSQLPFIDFHPDSMNESQVE